MTKESCFSTAFGTCWQSTQWLCCWRPCRACRMSPVTSGAVGGGQRVPHTWVSLCFTIRRKRNYPGAGVGFCREASADCKPPPTAFPWGCPLQSRASLGAAQGWVCFKEVKMQLLHANCLPWQQCKATGMFLSRLGAGTLQAARMGCPPPPPTLLV